MLGDEYIDFETRNLGGSKLNFGSNIEWEKQTKICPWQDLVSGYDVFHSLIFAFHPTLRFSCADVWRFNLSVGEKKVMATAELRSQFSDSLVIVRKEYSSLNQTKSEADERWIKWAKAVDGKRKTSWLLFCFSGIEGCQWKHLDLRMCLNQYVFIKKIKLIKGKG